MTDRYCRACAKKLIQHPNERKYDFARRRHCSRQCSRRLGKFKSIIVHTFGAEDPLDRIDPDILNTGNPSQWPSSQ